MATSTPARSREAAAEINLRKHAVLFAQEIACLQRPALTAAWAASLHLVWYYLSFSKTSIITTCCTVGMVAVAVDWLVQWYHRRAQRVRELLPPLLPSTLLREQGLPARSEMEGLDGPRTYAQLMELKHQCCGMATAVKDQILQWRVQHTDVFSGCMAAGCFVLGMLVNRVSGAFLLYLFVVVVLVVPILERVPQVRHIFSQIQPARVSDFLTTHSVPPLAQHEEEVRHLDAHMPDAAAVLATVVTPSLTRDRLHEELVKAELAEYLQEEDEIERRRAARANRNSALLESDDLAAAAAAAGIAVEGLRRRRATSSDEGADDDGFSLIHRSDAE